MAARRAASDSLAAGFAPLAAANAAGWASYRATLKPAPAAAAPVLAAYETSLLLLAAHDDKRNPGAGIASPTMPWAWGRLTVDKKDKRSAPYHLVWPRDLYQVGHRARSRPARSSAANAKLDFLLSKAQRADGHFPQNVQVDGRRKWTGIQMDEQALPIVLAWQLGRSDAATWRKLRRTAEFIVRHGPETEQERWENQSGYSPGTIAAEIAGLICAADLARRNGATDDAARYERVADRWAGSVQRWTATTNGPYSDEPVLPAAHQGPAARPRHALQHRRRRPDARRPAQGRRPELPRARAARRQAVRRPGDPQHARGGRRSGCGGQTPNGDVLAPLHLRRLRRDAHAAAVGG